jgi:hypothetical protein
MTTTAKPAMPELSTLAPAQALRHPLWLGALALLVCNDHLLKSAVPSWWTGKLSDVAGPLVAGVVLAVGLRLRRRNAVIAAFAAVVAFVAAINVSAACAAGVEAFTATLADGCAALGLPRLFAWHITVDPSDVLALLWVPPLAAVLVGAMARRPSAAGAASALLGARPATTRRFSTLALATAGAVASMATSQNPPTTVRPSDDTSIGWDAHLVLANLTEQTKTVRIRRLVAQVKLDCAAVAQNPTELLDHDLFAPARSFQLLANRTMPLGATVFPAQLGLEPEQFAARTDCDALLVDGGGLPMRLIFYKIASFPMKGVHQVASLAALDRRVAFNGVGSAGSGTGGADGLAWAAHSALFAAPVAQPGAPAPGCALHDSFLALEVSAADTSGKFAEKRTISAIEPDAVGCIHVSFVQGTPMWICIPAGAFPFKVDDSVTVHYAPLGHGGGSLDGVEIVSVNARLRAGRGSQPVLFGAKKAWWLTPRTGCGISHASCGAVGRPQDFEVDLGGGAKPVHLAPGGHVDIAPDASLYYLAGAELVAADMGCSGVLGPPGMVIETVFVERNLN